MTLLAGWAVNWGYRAWGVRHIRNLTAEAGL
jgi:hypothetical protein